MAPVQQEEVSEETFGPLTLKNKDAGSLREERDSLGQVLQGLHLDTLLLGNKIQRNCMKLKITACMCS